MKIDLSTSSIPELQPWRKDEIHEAWHAVFRSFHSSWKPWFGYTVLIVIIVVTHVPSFELSLTRRMLAGAIGGLILSQFQLSAASPLMHEWLKQNHQKNSNKKGSSGG